MKKLLFILSLLLNFFLIVLIAVLGTLSVYYYDKYKILQEESTSEDIDGSSEKTESEESSVNYYPVKYNSHTGEMQKVGQTFTVEGETLVEAVELQGSYGVGDLAYLYIIESSNPKNISIEDVVAEGRFIPEDIVGEEKFNVLLDRPVELKPNITYFMWFEVEDSLTEVGVGFEGGNNNETGQMYSFIRLVGGNGEILDDSHSWQPRNTEDLIFKFK